MNRQTLCTWHSILWLLTLACPALAAKASDDLPGLNKELAATMAKFGRPALSEQDIKAAILDGICDYLATPSAIHVDKVRSYAQLLASKDKFNLPTTLVLKFDGDDYALEYETPREAMIKGPLRWRIEVQIQHVNSGEHTDWIPIQLLVVAADQNKKTVGHQKQ